MRFTEIANPEDQLALWKLVSDKMWAAFEQPMPQGATAQVPQSSTPKGRVASAAVPATKPIPKISKKVAAKAKPKAAKAKRAPDLRLKTDPVRVRETEFFIIRKD